MSIQQVVYPIVGGPGGDLYVQTPNGLILYEQFVRVTGVDFTTTGQALVDITGLSIPLAPNAVYEIEAALSLLTSADTTGQKFGVQFSAAGASIEGQAIGSLTNAAAQSERIAALNTGGLAYLTTSAQAGQVLIKGLLTVGATPGNLTIQGLKVTSGTLTVRINSFLRAKRIV